MSGPNRYDWDAAFSSFRASGLPLQTFHKRHASQFAIDGWVPCCQTMRNHLADSRKPEAAAPQQVMTGSNLSIVELPAATPAVRASIRPVGMRKVRRHEKTPFRIKLPNGISLEFSTSRPEAFAIEFAALGSAL